MNENIVFLGIYIFLMGLVIGSFLNVVIHRLPRNESLSKHGSKCPGCGAPIKWYDNIPVLSYVILLGKCRNCKMQISFRYPTVELLTGLLFLTVYAKQALEHPDIISLSGILRLMAFLWFAAAMIAIAYIDTEFMIIPNKITYPTFVVGLVLLLIADPSKWLDMIYGILAGAGVLLVINLISPVIFGKQGMGMGDVKLGAVIGVFLGWQLALFSLFVASLLGTLYGLPRMFGDKERRREKFGFGPFMAIGALAAYFYGSPVIWWYLGLFRY
jgi:leader peptidase (prepilin peptidase) / N-methyltransferase